MKKNIYLAIIFLFLFANYVASAQTPARTGTDHAIFFVVQDFDAWPDFPNSSTQQVRDIEQELRNNYGFKTELLLNPTRKEIVDKLTKDLAKRSFQKDDQLLVYFSMHGHYEEGSQGALIPRDGLLEDASFDSWVTHPNLAVWLNTIPCEHILLSLDACYSGTFGGSRGAKPDKKPWETEDDCVSKAAKALQYKSRLFVTSGGVERTPTDSQLAGKWLEALRVKNMDGLLSFHSLFGVLSEANPAPMFGNFGSHAPGGDFALVDNKACAKDTHLTDIEHWKQVNDNPVRESVLQHLSRFPGCLHEEQAIALLGDRPSVTWTDSNGPWSDSNEPPNVLPGFVFVKGGTFQMGSSDGQNDELPHEVTLSNYYIAINEVTFDEYDTYCISKKIEKPDDLDLGREQNPIIKVTWIDAILYCNWRSELDGLQSVYGISDTIIKANWAADGYRLPTEAEWEFAARGRGKDVKWSGTSNEDNLSFFGNFCDHYCEYDYKNTKLHDGFKYLAPTGSFRSNDIGIKDMSGNVWEWCWDAYQEYSTLPQKDPHRTDSPFLKDLRIMRGGAWDSETSELRCSFRSASFADMKFFNVGFRLVRTAP